MSALPLPRSHRNPSATFPHRPEGFGPRVRPAAPFPPPASEPFRLPGAWKAPSFATRAGADVPAEPGPR